MPRIPCFSCYSAAHTSAQCTRIDGEVIEANHRDFLAALKPAQVPIEVMTHVNIQERQQHIGANAAATN